MHPAPVLFRPHTQRRSRRTIWVAVVVLTGALLVQGVPALASTATPPTATPGGDAVPHAGLAPGDVRPFTAAQGVPGGYASSGVDVSSHNAPVSWPTVAGSGSTFTFVKAVEGDYYTNPYFTADMSNAQANGFAAGAYAWPRPDFDNPVAQADFLLSTAHYTPGPASLPPMIDLEWGTAVGSSDCYGRTPAQLSAWLHTYLGRIQQVTGRDPVIYTNTRWWNPCTGNDTSFGGFPLDIANWSSSPDPLPAGWTYETFWQYTDNAAISGAGLVDGDVFNGSPANLATFAAAGNLPPVGAVESVSATAPTSVRVHGWALDPNTTAPIYADVYIDGVGVARLAANQSRTDVGAAYPGEGNLHGFDATMATTVGSHQVCVYGIDSSGGPNTGLGCRTVVTTRPFGFTAVAQTRVLDTRSGTGVPAGQLGAGASITLALPTLSTEVTAVVLNVTATNLSGAAASYISVCSGAQAVATCAGTSVLNPATGSTTANEVTVPVGADGTISLINGAGSVDLIGDVVGYLSGGFTASAATRVLDTRTGTGGPAGSLRADSSTTLTVPNMPTGTTAVVLNVTATNLSGSPQSYVSVCPAAQQPSSCEQTSVLNPTEGVTAANELTVPVAADGKIQLYNRAGSVDVIADVAGYVTGSFTSANPTRVLDTRTGTGTGNPAAQVAAGSPVTLTVPNLPAGTTAVVLNVTAANLSGTATSYISVCPAAQSSSSCTATSVLNPTPGVPTTNELTVPVDPDGHIRLFNHSGSVDLIGDVSGYFT